MAASILGRVSQLVRANVNAMLDSAEDPERMLDQLIRDFTDNIAEAEEAVAQTVGNLRLLEDDLREGEQAVSEWGSKAQAAASKAEEMRSAGQTAEAGRFDELAKVALRKQISFEESTRSMQTQVTQQTDLTNQLKDGLNKLRTKREELVSKRDDLVSRAKMAKAQRQVQEAVRDVSVMDPTSDLNRFEERIRREEAMARGMAEVSASSIEEQFASLEDAGAEAEVEARLASLRAGGSAGSAGSGSGGSAGSGSGGSAGTASGGAAGAGSGGAAGTGSGGSAGTASGGAAGAASGSSPNTPESGAETW